jgi:ABC-2 type transport system ATP-binding protein
MSSDHAPVLQLVDFGVRFPTFTFHPLTLSFAPGDRVALLGANGSGKTTMLAALAGQLPQHDGAVHADGVDVAPDRARHRARVGYLPDRPLGFPQTTVREHLALLARLFPTWDAAYAEALRERLALATDARLGTLSRGMGVKLAFVAAEAHRPPYLLLDEPTSGLDPLVRVELLTTCASWRPRTRGASCSSPRICSRTSSCSRSGWSRSATAGCRPMLRSPRCAQPPAGARCRR